MDYFPIFLNLKDQACLVVGGGDVAARKIDLLARAGARITVVAEEFSPYLVESEKQLHLNLRKKSFADEDIGNFRLIVAATDDSVVNARIYQLAKEKNIPVNVVDDPDHCSFIFPAIIDRSPVIAAITSSGTAPVLTRVLRAKIESLVPPAYGRLAEIAAKYRAQVKSCLHQASARRIFWENELQGRTAELVFAGKENDAEQELLANLEKAQRNAENSGGEVYLIGAGPGAPDLLTLRALRLIQQADVIVHDRLVSQEILDLARRDAKKIYVGKQRANHTLPQTSINALLAELAKSGKRVARLKGGDPFIFGRGGEEIETLMQQGIPFQVVPGITAASGCASYAGIPLTHREHAQSCTFVTGHLKDSSVNLNWTQLAAPNQTIVIYMGLVGLDLICSSLIAHGSPKTLPAALIQQGTTLQQKVLIGTLETLPELVVNKKIKAPTLVIIGTVVNLHSRLEWFQTAAADTHADGAFS